MCLASLMQKKKKKTTAVDGTSIKPYRIQHEQRVTAYNGQKWPKMAQTKLANVNVVTVYMLHTPVSFIIDPQELPYEKVVNAYLERAYQ